MSVNKDKTLAKVRTFSQDFRDHQPAGSPGVDLPTPKEKEVASPKPVPAISVVSKKPVEHKAPKHEPRKEHIEATPPQKTKEAIVPKTKSSTPADIPSFHEIQKASRGTKKNPPIVVKSKSTQRPRSGDLDATVITATKRTKKPKKTRSFIEGIRDWFKNIFRQRRRKEHTYQIPDGSHRKGVVQKATTKTGALFTTNNETLQAEILRRREAASHEERVSWSPNTEPGFNLLDAPETGTLPVHKEPEDTISTPVIKIADSEVPSPNQEDSRWEEAAVETPIAAEPKPEAPVPVPEPVFTQQPTVSEPEPIEFEPEPEMPEPLIEEPRVLQPQAKTSPLQTIKDLFRGNTSDINTNALALGFVAIVASIFIIVVAGRLLFSVLLVEPEVIVTPPTPPLLTSGSVMKLTVAETTTDSVLSTILQSDQTTLFSEQEIILLKQDGTRLSPEEIATALGWELHPNYVQTITEIRFVVLDSVQFAAVIVVDDAVTALGGMLQWESEMAEDLDSLLTTVTIPEESTRFLDRTYGLTDSRVLTDGIDEVLVYGFANEGTIVITKTSESFIRLAN